MNSTRAKSKAIATSRRVSVLDTSQVQWELLVYLVKREYSKSTHHARFNVEPVLRICTGRVRTSGSEGNHYRLGPLHLLIYYASDLESFQVIWQRRELALSNSHFNFYLLSQLLLYCTQWSALLVHGSYTEMSLYDVGFT